MKKIGLLTLLYMMISACNGIPDEVIQDKKKEVMEIHDRAMAEMGTISSLQKKIDNVQDTTGALTSVKADLHHAHQSMMDWMKDFSGTYDENWPAERKIEFLTEEKEKMAQVENKMNEAIEAAENSLKEYKNSIENKDSVPR